jgi:hypothetical protein
VIAATSPVAPSATGEIAGWVSTVAPSATGEIAGWVSTVALSAAGGIAGWMSTVALSRPQTAVSARLGSDFDVEQATRATARPKVRRGVVVRISATAEMPRLPSFSSIRSA